MDLKITSDFVKVEQLGEREILTVDPKGLELLAQEDMSCRLYKSDAADDMQCVEHGGRSMSKTKRSTK